ncbi:hypothetical protein [Methylorubrum extorquens]|uniref:Uncharacterized protein n=1 Tax=Methylorubrum extorquens (strain ATCC 14718 / DSM 1338 / JCM 2805 / NCIMB 9133 / AM1) TaxID=272630 RepID=C5B077_METEA|nr:hypothetical protein [Methylorubrum extorquens]ACS39427.1 Hypothetical protein MexAM1_META1p1565 [Methylorubrum extorquens AM1]MCP1542465.1 hypothetical protein [Methylorubrum extorquens]MCP1590190.1 hypothetical protein [Methylorubrum extorquens]
MACTRIKMDVSALRRAGITKAFRAVADVSRRARSKARGSSPGAKPTKIAVPCLTA